MNSRSPFKWRHFLPKIILLCVRWYLRYPLSYRNLKETEVEEVLRSKSQSQQKLSIPATPSVSEAKSENELFLNEVQKSEKKVELTNVKVLRHEVSPLGQSLSEQKPQAFVDWATYPYQSKDTYTLQNRANKVKERLLNCNNQGELVTLFSQGKITTAEVDWLLNNLLSSSECNRAVQIETTEQTNLFNQDRHEELKAQTTKEVRRIGWGKKQGMKYIKEQYGVSDRAQMSIEQLVEFRDYLRTIPTPSK